MPKRVETIVTYICSLCRAETDQSEKVASYQLVGRGKTLLLDLCPACEESESFAAIVGAGIREPKTGPEAKPRRTRTGSAEVVAQWLPQVMEPGVPVLSSELRASTDAFGWSNATVIRALRSLGAKNTGHSLTSAWTLPAERVVKRRPRKAAAG